MSALTDPACGETFEVRHLIELREGLEVRSAERSPLDALASDLFAVVEGRMATDEPHARTANGVR